MHGANNEWLSAHASSVWESNHGLHSHMQPYDLNVFGLPALEFWEAVSSAQGTGTDWGHSVQRLVSAARLAAATTGGAPMGSGSTSLAIVPVGGNEDPPMSGSEPLSRGQPISAQRAIISLLETNLRKAARSYASAMERIRMYQACEIDTWIASEPLVRLAAAAAPGDMTSSS